MKEQKFNVTGMSCSACSSRVEKVVGEMSGTDEVSVNLLTGTMNVKFDEEKESVDDIINEVEKAGYGAFEEGAGSAQGGGGEAVSKAAIDETAEMKHRLTWSIVFLIPLILVSLQPFMMGYKVNPHPLTSMIIEMVILAPIVFLNRKFFVKGIPGLLRGAGNMDTLVALGAGSSICYGTYAALRLSRGFETLNLPVILRYSNGIFFQSAGMILTLITIGKYLETKSKGKTSEAIEKLVNLTPKKATIIRDGEEIEIDSKDLVPGDIMTVRPGENFAADGTVIEGNTSVDQSVVTGESIPVYKGPGDEIVSGSVNGSGHVQVRCEKTGEDTAVSRIIELVEEASASKAPIAKLADKIAGIFVPTVIFLSVLTALIWLKISGNFGFALERGITVLVISCPCALGLATPVAIMTGTGRGAEKGILIKSGEAYQTASEIDTIVFDKTGTLTEGKPQVTDVKIYDGITEEEFICDAVSLEEGSSHPLSRAVKEYGKKKGANPSKFENFTEVTGRGIKAEKDGKLVAAGNPDFMSELGINMSEAETDMNLFAESGKTPLIFAEDGRVSGIIAVMDRPRPEAAEAISGFRKMNIQTVMLTGDNRKVAEAVGKEIGIDKVQAELMPEDKEKYIAQLQSEGKKVAMTGDGINDAPALVRADVGIAIGAGTDVAIESADAILTGSDLRTSVTAVELSKAVMKNIKQNLGWAFGYNVILIPMAAGVLMPITDFKLNPMIGALFMSMSSVIVVSNALRLRFFKGSLEKEIKTNMYKVKIEGMMCKMCQAHADKALSAMPGVESVEVNLEEKFALVKANREITEDEFAKVIAEQGYEVKGVSTL